MRDKKTKQKIYCYVDETGQDPRSDIFIVVAVIDDTEQNFLRCQLKNIEASIKIGKRKWKDAKRHIKYLKRSRKYLERVLKNKIATVYFKHFIKQVLYYDAMIEVIEKAIKKEAKRDYKAIIYIDGIDRKNAERVGNILKQHKIKSQKPRKATDESESLIRLADRWAGCIRGVFEKNKDDLIIFNQAKKSNYLCEIIK
ncbi:MAG: DUF3800 domain-containing protein [Patescibacteria group bacterium]